MIGGITGAIVIFILICPASAIKCYKGADTDASKWEKKDCSASCYYADDNSRGCAADNKVGCKDVKSGASVIYQCTCNSELCNNKVIKPLKCLKGEGDDRANWTSVDCKSACHYKQHYDRGTVKTERACGDPTKVIGWDGIFDANGNSLEYYCATDNCNGDGAEVATMPKVYPCYKGKGHDVANLIIAQYCLCCEVKSFLGDELTETDRYCERVRVNPEPVVLGCRGSSCICVGNLCNAPVGMNEIGTYSVSLGCHSGYGPLGDVLNTYAVGGCTACQKRIIKHSNTGAVTTERACSKLNPEIAGDAGSIGCKDVTVNRDVTATICTCRDKDLCNGAPTETKPFSAINFSFVVAFFLAL